MSKIAELKQAESLHDVAELLGFTPKAVAYLTRKLDPAVKYTTFEIPKRTGGTRTIHAPTEQLMLLQRKLADLLQACIDELSEANAWKNQMSHGFVPGRSIITNARKHRGKRYVLNVDLENFFGTINFGRVYGYFIKNKHFSLKPAVATVLSQIACHNGVLPQGSPCSPIISNLIGHILDVYLSKESLRLGCIYSRYADDLSFSTNLREFPAELAIPSADDKRTWHPGSALIGAINHADFKINLSKTRMQYKDSRQEVTGLIVNRKLNVRAEYRYKVRSMAHKLFSSGEYTFFGSTSNDPKPVLGTLAQLHGALGYIDSIDLYNRTLQKANRGHLEAAKQLSSKEQLYRRFLTYRFFHAAERPLIICEGKTDSVYLRCALKMLATQFPSLISPDDENVLHPKVGFFKYAQTSTNRILQLRGGGGDFKDFLKFYVKDIEKFKAPGRKHPVILLVDNDSASTPFYSQVSQICKIKPNGSELFTHIISNLYLVTTPPVGGSNTSIIEDLFPASLKQTVIDGKTFATSNESDSSNHYGKHIFSQYVAKHLDQIDFGGFAPLLTRIAAVLTKHYTPQAPTNPVF